MNVELNLMAQENVLYAAKKTLELFIKMVDTIDKLKLYRSKS